MSSSKDRSAPNSHKNSLLGDSSHSLNTLNNVTRSRAESMVSDMITNNTNGKPGPVTILSPS